MAIVKYRPCLVCFIILLGALCGISAAGERCDIFYENRLEEEIVHIRVKFSTPYDEPRYSSSQVNLPPGGKYRIGIQGTTLPEIIIIDLALKSLVFDDLSGIHPTNDMCLAVVHEDGAPRLRRLDTEGKAEGGENEYLTAPNRPNAVDKDSVLAVKTLDELGTLIEEQIEESRESLGELEKFSVEAGPIWNHGHALERCPEVAREWSEENDREARWTGHWRTTAWNEMSVCECMTGTAGEDETVRYEDEGWGGRAYFPVFWKEWFGVGSVSEREAAEGMTPVAMRFRLPESGAPAMLEELFEDLRVDGFRPLRFSLRAEELNDGEETEVDFLKRKDDKWDAHDFIMEALTNAYAGQLKGSVAWVEDEVFEKHLAGERDSKTRGVLCTFTGNTFEAIFVPPVELSFYGVEAEEEAEDERGEVEENDDRAAADTAQSTLSLPLRGNPSTGYFWSWTASGEGAVRETNVEYSQDLELPGSPATYTYFFAGEKEGDVVLRFVYSRTDPAKDDDRVNLYTLKVLPDRRIELVDMREDIVGKPQPR